MVNDEELLKIIKKNKLSGELTAKQKEDNIIEYTTFYRRNLDLFNSDYLGIDISFFQKQRINNWNVNDINNTLASRSSAKSFDVSLFCIDMCLLYSNMNILVTSKLSAQANNIVDEKIDKIFTSDTGQWSSLILLQLRRDGWIKIKKDDNGNSVVEFGNGSRIFCRPCGDSCRYLRANIVIVDEFVLIDKKTVYECAIPTLEVRRFAGRPKDYKEETKQIFLSSAKTKTNWGWRQLVNCVNSHYKDKRIKNGFFAGDIFTAIANGIQTKKKYISAKDSTDDMSFEQEYLNIFLSNSEDSMFKYEDFEQNQCITKAFYPRKPIDVLDGEEQTYVFDDRHIRYITTDIALATGNENDNTILLCVSFDKETGIRSFEYMASISGMNSMEQVKQMKRLYYEYKADYFEMDSRGVGYGLFDFMTIETYDDELGITYPAWGVCRDRNLQISSEAVLQDRIGRTSSSNTEDIIIPFVATAEINNQMHLSFRKALKDKLIKLLVDDSDAEARFENDDIYWTTKSSEYRRDKLLPFKQTKYMINEAISLNTVRLDSGNIKLKENNRMDTKDRYVTCAMSNMFADKLNSKYILGSDQEDDFDIDDWSFLSGEYQ